MSKIFISYRRSDSDETAGRLYDYLAKEFGRGSVFKDVDDVPGGADFRDVVAQALAACDVVIALIGKEWLTAADDQGRRRLDNDEDFVRIELQAALARGNDVLLIPVLLGGTAMPEAKNLPEPLRRLAFLNAFRLRPDPDFRSDVQRLISTIRAEGRTRWRKLFKRAVVPSLLALGALAGAYYLYPATWPPRGNPGSNGVDSTDSLPPDSGTPVDTTHPKANGNGTGRGPVHGDGGNGVIKPTFQLTVEANPRWVSSSVFVDGTPACTALPCRCDVTEGQHEVRVVSMDGMAARALVTVGSDTTVRLLDWDFRRIE